MTASVTVEQLRSAREKLERLRDASTPGPWVLWWSETDPDVPFVISDGITEVAAGTRTAADAEMIVVLNGTIDAQLAILDAAIVAEEEAAQGGYRSPSKIAPAARAALALAAAINGPVTS